jgi:hypothetical protein
MNAYLLPSNVASLTKLCAKQAARFAFHAVHLQFGSDTYRVEATDGKVMGVVTGSTLDATGHPAEPSLQNAPNGEVGALVPSKQFAKAMKLTAGKRELNSNPLLGFAAMVLGKAVTTLAVASAQGVAVSQPANLEGRFPNTESALPAGTSKVTFRIDARLLAELLTVASEFAPQTETPIVRIEVYWHDKPVVLKTENERQQFTGAIMPLS